MCDIIPTRTHEMKLAHFSLRKKVGTLNGQDEEVFAQAKQLALLRLEQSIADRRRTPPKGIFIDTERVPLADIESAWQRHQSGRRLVIIA